MKKILIITEALSYGGNNMVAMNIEKHLDKSKYECVYCVRRDRIGEFEDDAISRGVRVIHVPDSKLGYLKSYKFYRNLFKTEHFDIVHSHLPFISGLIFLSVKSVNKNTITVAHGHFSKPYNNEGKISNKELIFGSIYRALMRTFLFFLCDIDVSCSEKSGEYLFGKHVFKNRGIIINNGIEIKKYKFSIDSRRDLRKKLHINSNDIVLGHIGLMNDIKNQGFIIKIFEDFIRLIPNSFLILVGDGPKLDDYKKYAESLPCSNRIFFLGNREDVPELLSTFDCFVFPSVHEGFPVTLIEAQTSKLPCIVSDTVSSECKINDNYEICSLNDLPDKWAKKIYYLINSYSRNNINSNKLINEYDINNIVKNLEKIYQ